MELSKTTGPSVPSGGARPVNRLGDLSRGFCEDPSGSR